MNKLSRAVAVVSLTGFAAMPAFAQDLVTDATTAINAAKADGLTIGGVVIAAVAALVAISVILKVVRRV